ncbi:BadF/BadG/BcrA/BcrD ATPase family protein [Acetobacter persici]|uniref:BadF/BadG/BcrA/BcrD ATPase family protein n=1 Tax=Acetobacter persici TaxID=1076596 RepID=UPI0036DAF286
MPEPVVPPHLLHGPAILAVDGGGTKTLAVRVGPDASVQAQQITRGCNPFDQPDWQSILTDLVSPLTSGVQAAAFGIAGYGENRETGRQLQAHVQQLFPATPASLTNDVDMACIGAFAGGAGVLLLSGTGSMAWASDGAGQTARVGGWGPVFGDEGSAYWIGRKALQRVCQAMDGRAPEAQSFARQICAAMNWPDANPAALDALLGWYNQQDRPRPAIAHCAWLIDDMAEAGCPEARALITQAAQHLAVLVQTARTRFSDHDLPWSYAGSVFKSALLRTTLTDLCGAPQPPRLPPVGGGLVQAARLAGWPVDAEWIARLAHALNT